MSSLGLSHVIKANQCGWLLESTFLEFVSTSASLHQDVSMYLTRKCKTSRFEMGNANHHTVMSNYLLCSIVLMCCLKSVLLTTHVALPLV